MKGFWYLFLSQRPKNDDLLLLYLLYGYIKNKMSTQLGKSSKALRTFIYSPKLSWKSLTETCLRVSLNQYSNLFSYKILSFLHFSQKTKPVKASKIIKGNFCLLF